MAGDCRQPAGWGGGPIKYFIDTEFIEAGPHRPIALVSIGIVAEDGREFYRESSEFDPESANEWMRQNVLSRLSSDPEERSTLREIGDCIKAFVFDPTKPEFYGWYADYDWVVFCQTFGAMVDLPRGWPMYCRDLKQECDRLGNPKIDIPKDDEHNALADARRIRKIYDFLREMAASGEVVLASHI